MLLNSYMQLLEGAEQSLLNEIMLERDVSKYYYLTLAGESSKLTDEDRQNFGEVRKAMSVRCKFNLHVLCFQFRLIAGSWILSHRPDLHLEGPCRHLAPW